MASHDSLQALYVDQLRDLYDAEQQILRALPKMVRAASHPELEEAFQLHLVQTKAHVRRLERIFADLGMSPEGETCEGMKGVLKEGAKTMKEWGASDVRDAALIADAQRVEHYEIAGYGCAKTLARLLGREGDVELLENTESEEVETDTGLTELAETVVNIDALLDR
jgi:ferritin-like metal-binding protein YciE